MELGTYLEANNFMAGQEISRILWNLKVHFSQPPAPVLSQINPAHASHPTLLSAIVIFSSHLGLWSSTWSLYPGFPYQCHICTSLVPHTRYMPRLSHFSWFDQPNNISKSVQIVKILGINNDYISSEFYFFWFLKWCLNVLTVGYEIIIYVKSTDLVLKWI
jgi:hypothetical protein